MSEFKLKEYPREQYEEDVLKLLEEKGLSKAVKKYLDKIDEECRYMGVSYLPHRTIQEFLCNILFLCEKYEERINETDN